MSEADGDSRVRSLLADLWHWLTHSHEWEETQTPPWHRCVDCGKKIETTPVTMQDRGEGDV